MIRRDYILRMIEEFMQILSRLNSLKQGQQWQSARLSLDDGFRRLLDCGADAVIGLTETELLGRVIAGEPTMVVREKTLLLTAMLEQAGDVASGEQREEESRTCYLKGLHLLLQTLASGEPAEWPDFVPRVETFLAKLSGLPLPIATLAMLMQHYERAGDYAKAEDMLFAMAEGDPRNEAVFNFGEAFYGRLDRLPDSVLAAGGLPRAELEAGLASFHGMRPQAENGAQNKI